MRAGVLACQSEAVAISTSATGRGALTEVTTGRADVPLASAVGSAAGPVLVAALVGPAGVGVGGRPGLGGGVGGPISRPKPAARPAARPATRPATRPAKRPAHRPSGGNLRYGGHRGFRPGGYGGFHGARGGFRGGFHGGRGGFHGGRGGFRGGGRGGGRRSDFRLKHEIILLGYLNNGLGFYRFVYNGGEKAYVGVIAQEVQRIIPQAVVRGRDGYLRVFYDKVGLKFQTYDQWIASGAQVPPLP